jgi:hypothetical protein
LEEIPCVDGSRTNYLSKRLLQIIFLCCAINACTTDRHITSRDFISGYPEANIRVGSHFRYLGSATYDVQVKKEERDGYITHITESHIYIPDNLRSGPVIKGLDIRITNIREEDASFVVREDAYSKALDYGTINMAGKNYEYATWIIRSSMKGGNSKYLESKGYKMPSCLLVREFKREVDAKTRMKIVYWEESAMSNLSCGKTKVLKKSSTDGKTMLNAFHKRAADSFTIIK